MQAHAFFSDAGEEVEYMHVSVHLIEVTERMVRLRELMCFPRESQAHKFVIVWPHARREAHLCHS